MAATSSGPSGALLVGGPEDVAEMILHHSDALGGIPRVTFQMDSAELSHEQLLRSFGLVATGVMPIVNRQTPRVEPGKEQSQ